MPYNNDLGVAYHEWSKPGTPSLLGAIADWGSQPPIYKTYDNVDRIALPQPQFAGGMPTEQAIVQRRSARTYSAQPLTLDQLSRVLFLAGGESYKRYGHGLRTAPSSGALYPIEVYAVAHNVAGLEAGLYHYAVADHALHMLQQADLRGEMLRAGLQQAFLGQANVVLVFTSIFQRMRWKYQQRSYRYALLEAGHLGQNVCLAATSMGLGACAVGAFRDHDLNPLLGVDGTSEAAVYLLALGNVA